MEVGRVEIDKEGKIVVVAKKRSDTPREGGEDPNEWDRVPG
jgi:hypothetical protein